jgi:hypothetical protein
MTIPLERSRAVLWAGGLLVALNGDRRVPMEHRRAATAIARHFPTVEQVGLASLGSVLGKDGLFEHPRDCGDWLEKCPGRPLTYSTRLHWPYESSDDEQDQHESALQADDGSRDVSIEDFAQQVKLVDDAKAALAHHANSLYAMCVALCPSLLPYFTLLGWELDQAIEWTSKLQFDDNTKHVGHLILEDRVTDACEALTNVLSDDQGNGTS